MPCVNVRTQEFLAAKTLWAAHTAFLATCFFLFSDTEIFSFSRWNSQVKETVISKLLCARGHTVLVLFSFPVRVWNCGLELSLGQKNIWIVLIVSHRLCWYLSPKGVKCGSHGIKQDCGVRYCFQRCIFSHLKFVRSFGKRDQRVLACQSKLTKALRCEVFWEWQSLDSD